MSDDLIPPELAIDDPPFDVEEVDTFIVSPETSPARGFVIDSDDYAEWAMAHVAQIDADIEQTAELAKARLARIRRWEKEELDRLRGRREFFASRLIDYAAEIRARDRKRATINLPSGKISSSDVKPKVTVADEEALAEWAREHLPEDAVKVTTKVYVGPLRKHTRIVKEDAGWGLTLSCGHHIDVPIANDDGEPNDVTGSTFPCPICATNESQEIVERTVYSRSRVVDENGETVPGAGIDPGGLTFSVTT